MQQRPRERMPSHRSRKVPWMHGWSSLGETMGSKRFESRMPGMEWPWLARTRVSPPSSIAENLPLAQ
eukprot:451044-Alexandrium_andersonii.AAC.1